jgi:tRNA modification GTPase
MMLRQFADPQETIAALATAPGTGAIAVIRVSGKEALTVTNQVFRGKDLTQVPGHTAHFGTIYDGPTLVDEVLVTVFKAPRSYTGEDVTEISCHGSPFIVRSILQVLHKAGARYAQPGEFTRRAFAHGKMDLAQAEAVADLIASESAAAHRTALSQMRGGFSKQIGELREKLVNFASLIELELDFSEEDVEFADRSALTALVKEMLAVIGQLADSFQTGNAIKNGIPIVIAGKPNAGKSTLLNALLNEEKAIVSDIPGTTRDFIEDELVVQGYTFRFIDTAGLRHTEDVVESMGVQRTYQRMQQASLILYLFDVSLTNPMALQEEIQPVAQMGIPVLLVANKVDLLPGKTLPADWDSLKETAQDGTLSGIIPIAAGSGLGLDLLKDRLVAAVNLAPFETGNTVVTNARHYESLVHTRKALQEVLQALQLGTTGDFLAIDLRNALHFLGEITGQITTDDLLINIFSKFCIGK